MLTKSRPFQSDLSNKGLDELALMVADRGCLVFRDQKFTDLGFEEQKRIASLVSLAAAMIFSNVSQSLWPAS